MSYCQIHSTNNCIECAIARQTQEIVVAIKTLGEAFKIIGQQECSGEPRLIKGIELATPPERCPAMRQPLIWQRLMGRTSREELQCSRYEGHEKHGYRHMTNNGQEWDQA